MAVALPQAMPAIYMGDQYDLTRLQDNTKGAVDLLLRATAALQALPLSSGTGAPAFAATKGTLYLRTDGGAGTTLYINETGTAVWRAI